jgi:hypothetical protein
MIRNFVYQSVFNSPKPSFAVAPGFGQQPAIRRRPVVIGSVFSIVSAAPEIAYTTGPLRFSPSPEQFLKPRFPGLDAYTHVSAAPEIAYTTGPLRFSPSPEQFLKPRMPGLDTYSFVSPVPSIAFTPGPLQFSPSPEQFLQPRKPFEQYVWNFLAPKPPTLTFAPSPEQFLKPRMPGLDTYSFVNAALRTTPGPLGFSQDPHQLAMPRAPGLDQYVWNLPPPTWSNFGTGPIDTDVVVFATVVCQGLFTTLRPIAALIPPPVSASPYQFLQPRNPGLDTYSFVSAAPEIAYTKGPFGFSASPYQFLQPRNPGLDQYVWNLPVPTWSNFGTGPVDTDLVFNVNVIYQSRFNTLAPQAPAVQTTVFSTSPEQFLKPRNPGLDTYSFVSAVPEIAYTTGPFGFSASPYQFLQPRNPGLDGYSYANRIIATPTPSALSFSPSPEQFLKPRMPGLDTYSFVSAVPEIAYTTGPFGFSSQPPPQFAKPYPPLDQYGFGFRPGLTPFAGFQNDIAVVMEPFVFGEITGAGRVPPLPPFGAWGYDPIVALEPFVIGGNTSFTFIPPTGTVTPSAFGFSASPQQLAQPRNPGLDTYSFVFAPPLVVGAFGCDPAVILVPLTVGWNNVLTFVTGLPPFAGFQNDVAVIVEPAVFGEITGAGRLPPLPPFSAFGNDIAVVINPFIIGGNIGFTAPAPTTPTPSAFGFAASPYQFAQPRNPGLDAYSFEFFPPALAVTPGPFGFAPSPSQIAKPYPPLDAYSFEFFPPALAATPGPFGFSQSPPQLAKPYPPLDVYRLGILPALTPFAGFQNDIAVVMEPFVFGENVGFNLPTGLPPFGAWGYDPIVTLEPYVIGGSLGFTSFQVATPTPSAFGFSLQNRCAPLHLHLHDGFVVFRVPEFPWPNMIDRAINIDWVEPAKASVSNSAERR